MTHSLDDHAAALLGKSLLGQSTEAERRELAALSESSPQLRGALELIEQSQPGFRVSSLGQEIDMTTADLPDYYRPQRLARGMQRWFRTGVRDGAAAAILLTVILVAGILVLEPGLPVGLLAAVVGVAAVLVLAAGVVAARRRLDTIGREMEAGADEWRRTVERMRQQEARYLSRAAKRAMVLCFAVTPVFFVLSGLTSPPLDRAFAFTSWATIAVGVVVLQRRRMLRGLRRG